MNQLSFLPLILLYAWPTSIFKKIHESDSFFILQTTWPDIVARHVQAWFVLWIILLWSIVGRRFTSNNASKQNNKIIFSYGFFKVKLSACWK